MAVNFVCSMPSPLDIEETMQPWIPSIGWRSVYNKISNSSIQCSTTMDQIILPDNNTHLVVYYNEDFNSHAPNVSQTSELLYLERNESVYNIIMAIPFKMQDYMQDYDYMPFSSIMDEDVQCTMKESYYIVVCMCNQLLTAKEYCLGANKTLFEGSRIYRAYYIYGAVLSNINIMYEYYTQFRLSYRSGYLLCNQVTATINIASSNFIYSPQFKIEMWINSSSSRTWICLTQEEMKYDLYSNQSLYLNFRYKYFHFTEKIALFPTDLSHWDGIFEDNKCIKIQPSAFHEYCLCMGRNKSERFCKSTPSFLQKHDEFRSRTDIDRSSSSYSLTSLSAISTTAFTGINAADDDERPDDGWRWEAIQNNYEQNVAWMRPPNCTLLMICCIIVSDSLQFWLDKIFY